MKEFFQCCPSKFTPESVLHPNRLSLNVLPLFQNFFLSYLKYMCVYMHMYMHIYAQTCLHLKKKPQFPRHLIIKAKKNCSY